MSPHIDDCGESFNGDSTTNTNGTTNGTTNGNGTNYTQPQEPTANGIHHHHNTPKNKSPYLLPTNPSETHDLVCIGFGPASLAVAVALHDSLSSGNSLLPSGRAPKVLFLEKQGHFAWHAGMLLPGAKMQISFLKDLATLRNPRSEFTFLNYLHNGGRLVDFTNLGTFLPCRVEYEDYLRWCASFFEDVVRYDNQVTSVSPDHGSGNEKVETFTVRSRNVKTGATSSFRARNVLVAVGGQPKLPGHLSLEHPRIIHSSQYAHLVPRILTNRDAPYRVAVVGAGQSAAEIFSNIQTLYPNSRTHLVMRSEFLRPSDDSPFINSIFNPSYIDELHPKPAAHRQHLLTEARATNYGVVRLELIEHLYERMYDQKRQLGVDETKWPHRIMGGRLVTGLDAAGSNPEDGLTLRVCHVNHPDGVADEVLNVDLIIAATGYQRNSHVDMLKDAWDMLPPSSASKPYEIDGWQVKSGSGEASARTLEVGRDYRVKFEPSKIQPDSGVWLQGCCEGTHGISDTLLSVLATRSQEIVNSIFGGSQGVEEQKLAA